MQSDFGGLTLVASRFYLTSYRCRLQIQHLPNDMRQITIGFSLLALFLSVAEPAFAGRDGFPGRRVGGGSRYTSQPKLKQAASATTRLTALAFASRANLPTALKLKAIYSC